MPKVQKGQGMDWKGIIRELRLFATRLQTDRFYALYLLLAILVVVYAVRG